MAVSKVVLETKPPVFTCPICLSVNRRKYEQNSWPRELRVDGPKVGDVFVAHWWVNALAVSKVVSKVLTVQRSSRSYVF